LCGLCDAATASAFFPAGDARIAGLALFNPWVRTRSGQSEAVLKHYYRKRLLEYAFWRRLLSGRINVIEAASGLWRNAREASLRYDVNAGMSMEGSSLPERVAAGLLQYSVPILVVLSGNDLVAAEFRLAASQSRSLNDALQRRNVRQVQMPEADHTFSRTVWGVRAVGITLDWLRQEFADLLIETETAKSSTL